jgi:arsenical pump membrane protein
VQEIGAFSSLAVTLGLVLTRPRWGPHGRQVGPAVAALTGVVLMLVIGAIDPSDARTAARVLWRPLLAITAIMITTGAALRLGSVQRAAAACFPHARGSATRLFLIVFGLSACTAAVLNNDSAVLLLTPLVVTLVAGLYPDRPQLIVPFAFTVFMAAGVAPLVTANPMNLIVADYADIDFNEYALTMLPISLAGWAVSLFILHWIFRRDLRAAPVLNGAPAKAAPWTRAEIQGVIVVLVVLLAYPIVSYLGGSVWIVAAAGAALATALCFHHTGVTPSELVRRSVRWEILIFLFGVFMLAIGLRNTGVVGQLSDLYDKAGDVGIGAVSAFGSAIINNHSMALTNLLAIQETPDAGKHEFLAALIGGDLGPRLLPMGSLAGLLWYASLRTMLIEVPLGQFILVGAAVTLPTLAVSLGLLAVIG